MKKSLVALAALAAATGAFAQSSVTMFGVVDATYAYGSGSIAKKTQLTNSGYNSSRFGVRGAEDLGGGMKGTFHLEAGLANDNGQGAGTNSNNQATGTSAATAGTQGLTFNRRSTVGLMGSFGEVRLGREYTPHFWNHTFYDAFGTNGVGTSQALNSSIGGPTTVRASNSITYLLPGNLGGLNGQVQYFMGENASGAANSKDGGGLSLSVGYGNGPLSVNLATGTTKFAGANITSTNLGGSYDLGVAKISLLTTSDKVQNGAKGTGFNLGVNAPMGAGEIRAAYSTGKVSNLGATPTTTKLAVGYVHNLSKRTAVYGTLARVGNKNGAAAALNGSSTAANNSSTGMDFGVRHAF